MFHALLPVLATASKTTSSGTTSRTLVLTLAAVELVVGVGLAELRRRFRGSYPWRLHSVIWGLFLVFTQGLAVILLVIAWFTTKPRPTDPGPRTRGMPGNPLAGRSALANRVAARLGGRAPLPAPAEPVGVVPGTYGTSLPPHDSSGDGGDPAGWRPDPTGRHEYRYWTGTGWSRHVSDAGKRSTDAM